jgi:hypothetical protein
VRESHLFDEEESAVRFLDSLNKTYDNLKQKLRTDCFSKKEWPEEQQTS